jgi:hypothetical protein
MLNMLPSTSSLPLDSITIFLLCSESPWSVFELDTRVKQLKKILFFISSISFSWGYRFYSFLLVFGVSSWFHI